MDTYSQQPTPLEQFSRDLGSLIDELTATGQHLHRLPLGQPNDDLMADWRQTIHWLRELSEHGLKLAVLGSFSSGKSTLINSLLELDCLAVGVQATTATVTRIRRSPDGQQSAQVQYKTAGAMLAEIQQQVDADRVALGSGSEDVAAALLEAPSLPDIDWASLDDNKGTSACSAISASRVAAFGVRRREAAVSAIRRRSNSECLGSSARAGTVTRYDRRASIHRNRLASAHESTRDRRSGHRLLRRVVPGAVLRAGGRRDPDPAEAQQGGARGGRRRRRRVPVHHAPAAQ